MAFTKQQQDALIHYDMRWRGAGIHNADEWAKGLSPELREIVRSYFGAVVSGKQEHVISDEMWVDMMKDPKFNAKCQAARSNREAQLSANAFWLFGLLSLVGFAVHPAVGWVLLGLAFWMLLSSFAATQRETNADRAKRNF
jgi:hypothetical protein